MSEETSGPFRRVVDGAKTYLPITVVATLLVGAIGLVWALTGIRSDVREHIARVEAAQSVISEQLTHAVDAIERNQAAIDRVTGLAQEVIEGRLDSLERRQDVVYERIRGLETRLSQPP